MPKIPPPAYLAAGLLAQHLLAPKGRRGARHLVAGSALASASVAMLVLANQRFHRHHTTVNPIDPSRASTLVTEGVFKLTRNPMYVGMAGLLAAHAVARGGWMTQLPLAAFVAVIDRVQIPAEERALTARFGDSYTSYLAEVPRWIRPT
ncbi:Protein-S-isoprenylcysteine O-methyltransferase Ste14 [Nocardioides terrae]|uniref:Protein-S-isoprenylcysteine O-methyltransferase Ste14 n=1 Tax=Nocardioides terrae TaxID=574651 RepID=A0A1I1DZC6_9ACTN|nr:isoprenylcysteine carboxylmethyltransferase family protein [Nocardioides terrae]SFB77943.1 Protein-S-isoprenylcysteine O-methyltransferase Ste14 [Nocardioides terrae]